MIMVKRRSESRGYLDARFERQEQLLLGLKEALTERGGSSQLGLRHKISNSTDTPDTLPSGSARAAYSRGSTASRRRTFVRTAMLERHIMAKKAGKEVDMKYLDVK